MSHTPAPQEATPMHQPARHTPGPWKVITYRRREGRVYEVRGGGGSLALMTEFSQINPKPNAFLMAAAPQLLKVCQMLFDEDGDPKREQLLDIAIFFAAQRAIAHATGQEEAA